jgi:hypothetical protein
MAWSSATTAATKSIEGSEDGARRTMTGRWSTAVSIGGRRCRLEDGSGDGLRPPGGRASGEGTGSGGSRVRGGARAGGWGGCTGLGGGADTGGGERTGARTGG